MQDSAAAILSALNPASVAVNTPSVVVDNVRYGAEADERGPIGGGGGYAETFSGGDFAPRSIDDLIAALAAAQPGQVVFLAGDIEFNLTARWFTDKLTLEIPAGVALAGDRGLHGSPGALLASDAHAVSPMLRAAGPDVTVTGLRLRGPDQHISQDHHERSFGGSGGSPESRGHKHYYLFPNSNGIQTLHDRLTVANCEISAWSHAGVRLTAGTGHHVRHCHIHHNRRNGLGYGVSFDVARGLVERNLFEFNRHDIAGTGRVGSGYEACHNVVLAHEAFSHHFDMHGGGDRRDGTDVAGDFLNVHHNAFYGSGMPVCVRGVPSTEAEIHHNWFPRHRPSRTPQEMQDWVKPISVYSQGRTSVHDNAYGLIAVV